MEKPKEMKSCVAITARYEETYIQECICHNYLLGFDKIIVALHNDPTDERPDRTHEQILKLPQHVLDKVEVVPFSIAQTETLGFYYQVIAYQNYILPIVQGHYEWMAMFDVDECFYDSQRRPINEILSDIPKDAGQVIVHWLEFGHNNQILSAPPNETRLNWFTKRAEYPRTHFKSIVRIDALPDVLRWYWCHYARVLGRSVNTKGEVVLPEIENWDALGIVEHHVPHPPYDDTAFETCLVHYWSGAMEDWVNRTKRWSVNKGTGVELSKFLEFTVDVEDHRMSIYAEELKELLKQCKN